MPLPTPLLDDRQFQDIVDEAKRLIPRYCPEWTDHNVSDPGVTLIELFAWMTEILLYRVNQVPDKMYITFLELIGIRLEPPRAARAPITFYLSAPQAANLTIAAGTEVATVRTETSPAIIFTTEADLTIRVPEITGAFTRNTSRGSSGWTPHDLRQLALPGRRIQMFPQSPAPDDAFYLAFQADHSHHVLALIVDCELARGAGIDPTKPPFEWQVWTGGLARWATCEVEYDGTGGFNNPGEIILHLPHMVEEKIQNISGYWLRCRLTDVQAGAGGYLVSPDLERLRVEARGGTVSARHAITVRNEILGYSDGMSGQVFKLQHVPLLARDRQRERLIEELPKGGIEKWEEVDDFANSGPTNRHYTLDSLDGTLQLGPSLLQPDGTVYNFGTAPAQGSRLRFSRYQYGGGVIGNVPTGTLTVLKSSIPYVARVFNRVGASGGLDQQSLDDAKVRAPHTLRTRTRAVTADDHTYLTEQVEGVARAQCLAPDAQPGSASDPKPGEVLVLVVPQVGVATGPIAPESLTLSAELRAAVLAELNQRRLIGTRLEVRAPQYIWVSVQATLHVQDLSDPTLKAEVQRQAEAELYRYLNPYVGGPTGEGWPFGRDLHLSEIYALLQRVPAVEFVEQVSVSVSDLAQGASPKPSPPRLRVPQDALICSAHHTVKVS
jgi:predicted phage baseplate assembly protein